MEEICKKIYFLLESNFPECLTEDFRIILGKVNLGGGASYSIGYSNIKNDDIVRPMFSLSSLDDCFNQIYKEKGKDTNWNKLVIKLNSQTRNCDLEYQFDAELQSAIIKELEYQKSTEWRSRFIKGGFSDEIREELISRGIQKEAAGCLGGLVGGLTQNIEEKWKEVYGEINISTLSFDAFYLDLNNQKKEVILYPDPDLEYRKDSFKYLQDTTKKGNLIWNHATFFATFDGDFSISLNYAYAAIGGSRSHNVFFVQHTSQPR